MFDSQRDISEMLNEGTEAWSVCEHLQKKKQKAERKIPPRNTNRNGKIRTRPQTSYLFGSPTFACGLVFRAQSDTDIIKTVNYNKFQIDKVLIVLASKTSFVRRL